MTGKPPFERVVSAHGSAVLRVCRAILGPADADDAWSETFLSALKAYPELPADANVEAWLVTIAHRKAIDVTRAAARRAIPVAETPDTPTVVSGVAGGGGPAAAGVGLVADDDLADAITRLPAKQKQAVAYHYLTGLSYAEVAAILGGTAEAARRAAADGIARLRLSYPAAAGPPVRPVPPAGAGRTGGAGRSGGAGRTGGAGRSGGAGPSEGAGRTGGQARGRAAVRPAAPTTASKGKPR